MTQSRRRDVEFNHLASYRRAAFMTLAEARQGIRLEARRQRQVASLAWESGETDGCLRTSPFMANRNTRSPRRRCGHDHSLSSVAIPGAEATSESTYASSFLAFSLLRCCLERPKPLGE